MIDYFHVDVFSPRPFTGNSLTVFPESAALSAGQMLAVTLEMRHFESIFLEPAREPNTVRARVFDTRSSTVSSRQGRNSSSTRGASPAGPAASGCAAKARQPT